MQTYAVQRDAATKEDLERSVQYRGHAAVLLRISEQEADVRQKAEWLEMAALYHQLAALLEATHPLYVKP